MSMDDADSDIIAVRRPAAPRKTPCPRTGRFEALFKQAKETKKKSDGSFSGHVAAHVVPAAIADGTPCGRRDSDGTIMARRTTRVVREGLKNAGAREDQGVGYGYHQAQIGIRGVMAVGTAEYKRWVANSWKFFDAGAAERRLKSRHLQDGDHWDRLLSKTTLLPAANSDLPALMCGSNKLATSYQRNSAIFDTPRGDRLMKASVLAWAQQVHWETAYALPPSMALTYWQPQHDASATGFDEVEEDAIGQLPPLPPLLPNEVFHSGGQVFDPLQASGGFAWKSPSSSASPSSPGQPKLPGAHGRTPDAAEDKARSHAVKFNDAVSAVRKRSPRARPSSSREGKSINQAAPKRMLREVSDTSQRPSLSARGPPVLGQTPSQDATLKALVVASSKLQPLN
eukprot:TRINITY_DN39044_c0_g2_i1.p1 TRINITY_DN39044_c0_g2~~TRINITY_DN39044_c0_g2_i1.p1  ORF type:complete len:425 (+),score=71.24 TRINITY_DN39044_c0_g2_i1:84-1277(+)